MEKYLCLARKFVDRGVVKIDFKVESGDWVEVETELGMIAYKVLRIVKSNDHLVGKADRILENDDLNKFKEFAKEEEEAQETIKKLIFKYKLEMKPITAMISNDEQRLIFYFTADDRVDFRRLVRELTSIYDKSIRLQHINSRIAAMIEGGVGPCGREICCRKGVIDTVDEIPSQLLSNQDLNSIDSTKLSGLCNKLVCCLKYEDELYQKLKKDFPKVGEAYKSKEIVGKVVDVKLLAGTILVKAKDGSVKEVKVK
jgi:cell fate regulator YaaT (PSP1 superfamily)